MVGGSGTHPPPAPNPHGPTLLARPHSRAARSAASRRRGWGRARRRDPLRTPRKAAAPTSAYVSLSERSARVEPWKKRSLLRAARMRGRWREKSARMRCTAPSRRRRRSGRPAAPRRGSWPAWPPITPPTLVPATPATVTLARRSTRSTRSTPRWAMARACRGRGPARCVGRRRRAAGSRRSARPTTRTRCPRSSTSFWYSGVRCPIELNWKRVTVSIC